MAEVHALRRGCQRILFGAIDHDWLIRVVEQRVVDRRVICLTRKWQKAGVTEDEEVT